jgi:dienelactone hydrolase
MVHDVQSAVDLLSAPQSGPDAFRPAGDADALPAYPRVNPAKIYAVGYSIGAAAGLYAAALVRI